MRKKHYLLAFGAIALLASCGNDTDVYNENYTQEVYSTNFVDRYGNVASNQDWNTTVNLTAKVNVDYTGSHTVKFYTANPFTSDDARLLATGTVEGGSSASFTFNSEKLSTLYAVCFDEQNMGVAASATVSANTAEFKFGGVEKSTYVDPNMKTSSSSSSRMRRAAAEIEFWYGYTADRLKVTDFLPEKVNAAEKQNNYEMKSNGKFVIYPVYGVTSANDAVGIYYYDPENPDETYTEETLIADVKAWSSNVSFDTSTTDVWSDEVNWQTTTDYLTNSQDWWSWGLTMMGTKGFTIDVPEGWNVGFWISNPNYANVTESTDGKSYSRFYSNKYKNPKNEYYSAVATDEGSLIYIGLEDWGNTYGDSDFDCNDIVFAMCDYDCDHHTRPSIVVPEEEDKADPEPFCIAYEDLGSTDDFDFNDVVLYIYPYSNNGNVDSVRVDMVAAGGTLPVEVFFDGQSLFSKEGWNMVNTSSMGAPYATKTITTGLEGFDLEDSETTSKFYICVSGDTQTYNISPNREAGKAPQALIIAGNWAWPKERVDVGTAYPDFDKWVSGQTDDWTSSKVAEYVIE